MIERYIPIVMMAIVAIWIVGGIFHSLFANKKRRASIKELADELGLNWSEDATSQHLSRHSGFNLFNRGRARKMKNLIEGVTDEVQIGIFDYQFTTGHGKQTRTHRQTIASLTSPQLNCPEFTMRPEGILDRVGGMLGFQDIDFDSHPSFSKSFVLKGPNEEAIRSFFQPAMLEFFETQSNISVEGYGNTMCFYRAGKIVKPDHIKDLLGDAYNVFGCLVDA